MGREREDLFVMIWVDWGWGVVFLLSGRGFVIQFVFWVSFYGLVFEFCGEGVVMGERVEFKDMLGFWQGKLFYSFFDSL